MNAVAAVTTHAELWKWASGILAVLIISVVGFLMTRDVFAAIDQAERDAIAHGNRITRLEEKSEGIEESLERIEEKLDMLIQRELDE